MHPSCSSSALPPLPLPVSICTCRFPETVTALITGQLAEIDGKPVTHMQAVGPFMDGLGIIFHHSATAFCVCIIVADIVSESAMPEAIFAVSLPILMQHWLVQFKYVSTHAYMWLLLISEVWWEIELIQHMDKFRYWHEQRCLWGMLVAHWLYWLGGAA